MSPQAERDPLSRGPGQHRPGDPRSWLRGRAARGGKKDVDQGQRMLVLQALMWSTTGAILGGLWGVFGMVRGEWGVGMVALMAAIAWAVAFFGPLAIVGLGGRLGQTLYNPSGSSTPRRREYSHAESLVARGRYEDAISAFEIAIAEDGSDSLPYLRIARVYRDQLRRYEDSARWFKRALAEPEMHSGLVRLTAMELVELHESKLGDPTRSAPLLARMSEERSGTPEGDWAEAELTRVRALMTGEA